MLQSVEVGNVGASGVIRSRPIAAGIALLALAIPISAIRVRNSGPGADSRTNELDAGKRRPMIGGRGRAGPARVGVALGRGSPGLVPRVGGVWRSGSHSHPFGRPRGPGAMTVLSGDRAAQSVRRARQGRLRMIYELARGLATPPGLFHRVPVWAADAALGCGMGVRSASVSRCQARVASLRATAVVAIFFPRRLAMAW